MSQSNKEGFTLVEIVIVLAIAALILAGILIAVNGTQIARRDTQRKNDAARVGSMVEQAASNYDGNLPGQVGGITTANFTTRYVNTVRNPLGGNYAPTYNGTATCPNGAPAQDAMNVGIAGRRWSVAVGLENGDAFCAHS